MLIAPGSRVSCLTLTPINHLEGEQNEESHHQTEQPHGLWQSESQDGIWEELLFEGGVASVADNQTAEHWADTSSWSSSSDSGGAGTNVLGSLINVLSWRGRLEGAHLGEYIGVLYGGELHLVGLVLHGDGCQWAQDLAAAGHGGPGDWGEELAGIHDDGLGRGLRTTVRELKQLKKHHKVRGRTKCRLIFYIPHHLLFTPNFTCLILNTSNCGFGVWEKY